MSIKTILAFCIFVSVTIALESASLHTVDDNLDGSIGFIREYEERADELETIRARINAELEPDNLEFSLLNALIDKMLYYNDQELAEMLSSFYREDLNSIMGKRSELKRNIYKNTFYNKIPLLRSRYLSNSNHKTKGL